MLDIYPFLMLFVFVLFLTLLVVLNKMLFKPLLKFMDDRDNSIAKDLKAAKGLGGNIDELNAKADENISNAKSEAANIRQEAINAEKELSAKKAEVKKSELDSKYAKFTEQLAVEKENLKESLLSNMPLFKKSLKAKFSKL